MPEPDISIIVPTRNREVLVDRLLGQLARIDDDLTYEVIVIDEGSSDGTPELLARYARDHGFRVIRHDDPVGLPAARNVGASAARGRWLAWIDDDDLTSTDRLRRQHEDLVATGSRWSCAARVDIDDDLTVIGHRRCPPLPVLPGLLRVNTLPTAAQGLLVERALAEEVGGYDESLRAAEDWEYCIRLAAVAEPRFLDEPLVGYRTGVASMSTDTSRMDTAIQAVVDKHADLYARHGVIPDWAVINHTLLAADLLGGRRQGLRRAWRVLRAAPSPKAALRTAAIVAAPGWFERRAAETRRRQVPADWVAQARAWLASVPQR